MHINIRDYVGVHAHALTCTEDISRRTSMTKIKQMRNRTGLSQRRFAEEFGIPARTLQQWEQAKSSPPTYVENMLEGKVNNYVALHSADNRHHIPKKEKWKVCIDDPFDNCERIYPIQQRKVRELIDDIVNNNDVKEIRVFGSSVTESCHIGSDVDLFVESEEPNVLLTEAHDFEYDLWTNASVDPRLAREISKKGVVVYA